MKMKRSIIGIIGVLMLVLVGCQSLTKVQSEDNTKSSYYSETNNGELVSVSENGVDVTKEVLAYQASIKSKICALLNREEKDLEFLYFTLLGEEGATIDVTVDTDTYTVSCDERGNLISIVKIETDVFLLC